MSVAIEGLSRLKIEDDHLVYSGRPIRLSEICNVQFTATETKHSINFIPAGSSYSSELYLHLVSGRKIHIRQERAFRGKTQKRKMESVWQAAEVISIATFNQRVESYEREIERLGFISVGDYQITKDGGLFKNRERLFSVIDPDVSISLGPFHLSILQNRRGIGRLLGKREHVIPIDIDRDCILYILKNCMSISFRDTPVRDKVIDHRKIFFSAVIRLGAKLAKADGTVSREEILALKKAFDLDSQGIEDQGKIFKDAIESGQAIDSIARDVFSAIGDNQDLLEYVVIGLLQVAVSDQKVHPKELRMLLQICGEFGFESSKTSSLFAMFGIMPDEPKEERDRQHDREERGRHSAGAPGEAALEELYLRILGLQPGASLEEIRVTYRRLALRHHPDTLRSKGIPIDEMRKSEEVLKKINEAYEYLARRP